MRSVAVSCFDWGGGGGLLMMVYLLEAAAEVVLAGVSTQWLE